MSASLVGSEMCIRDRNDADADADRRRRRRAPSRAPPKSWSMKERGGAVSYTHLTLPTICSV
eukprot:11392677-Alexandrium_andersonii.AAC.1